VPADVNEGLLLEEFLLVLVLESLSRRFETETSEGLDQRSARGKLAASLEFVEVLVKFGAMLWV